MRVLALDTATRACSAALWEGPADADPGAAIRAQVVEEMDRGHAEAVLPMVHAVLAEAGCDFASIDRLAATRGPGSFTGVRAGLAALRGLALACGAPQFGVTTLAAIAAAARARLTDAGRAAPVLAVLATRRRDVYAQLFAPDGAARTTPALCGAPDAVRLARRAGPDLALAGSAADPVGAWLADAGIDAAAVPGCAHPEARWVAALSAQRPAGDAGAPAPLYLRPPDATPARDGGRVRPRAAAGEAV